MGRRLGWGEGSGGAKASSPSLYVIFRLAGDGFAPPWLRLTMDFNAPCPLVGSHVSRCPYLSTLADAPPISFSTSSTVAMEVSPGVVIAKAPCAAPYSTAILASPVVINP